MEFFVRKNKLALIEEYWISPTIPAKFWETEAF